MRTRRPVNRAGLPSRRRRIAAAILALLGAPLAACDADLGSVSGTIHVGSAPPGVRVVAQLYRVSTDAQGAVTLHVSAQYSVGLTGVTDAYDYSFLAVEPGRYLVGAYVDVDGDGYLNACEPYTINEFQELLVDPGETLHHDQDVHVLRSSPGTATLRGTVHVGARAQNREITVGLMDGPLNGASSRFVAIRAVCDTGGAGEARPFTLFNVPAGRLELVAWTYPNDENDLSIYALLPTNPLRIDPAEQDEHDGLSLWLDAQSPDLGSITGTVTFSAPVEDAVVQIMTFDREPGDPDARLTAVELIRPEPNAESVTWTLRSLALRPHYVAAYVEVTDATGAVHATARVHQHNRSPAGVQLTTEAPHGQVSLSLGLGRVSGDVELGNARPTLKSVFVLALIDGDVQAWDEFPGSVVDGVFTTTVPYTLFGLDDGTYQMAVVPDISGDHRPEDEIGTGWTFVSDPPEVTIVGGSRVGADFRLQLP